MITKYEITWDGDLWILRNDREEFPEGYTSLLELTEDIMRLHELSCNEENK